MRTVSVGIDASVTGLTTASARGSLSVKRMAAEITASGKASSAAIDRLETSQKRAASAASGLVVANKRLAVAQTQAQTAAEKHATAQKRLADLQKSGTATERQLTTAASQVSAARRQEEAATLRSASAEAKFQAATRESASAQRKLTTALDQGKRAQGTLTRLAEQAPAIDQVGTSLMHVGTVGAAGLGAAAKAAIDWESAWTGVVKTVDWSNKSFGTAAEQQDRLQASLRDMAKTMPTSHDDIAAVAEAAGQLGVRTPDIAGFTKVMVQLGDTTNLTAEEASTSLAQFMNIMGTTGGEVSNLGATIVGLGNDGASTERDIVQMGLRIAGAGKTVGLSEQQVLAYASAVSSLGIQSELGGTAVSRAFIGIDEAVRTGGKGLDALAKTSGVTTDQFRQDFQNDAAGAVDTFIQGLGKMQAEGGDSTAVLKTLGLNGAGVGQTLRGLAASGTILTDSLKTSNTAWSENTALVKEAETRYGTTGAKAQIAWNNIKDSAITAGQAMLPMLASIFDNVSKVASVIGGLPTPVRGALTGVAALVAALGLVGGGALKMIASVGAAKSALETLATTSRIASGAIGGVKAALGPIGIALTIAGAALAIYESHHAKVKEAEDNFASALQSVTGELDQNTIALNTNVRAAAVKSLQDNGGLDAARNLGLNLQTVTQATLGNAAAYDEVSKSIRSYYGIGGSGGHENIKQARILGDALGMTSQAAADMTEKERKRREVMELSGQAADGAAASTADLGAAVTGTATSMDDIVSAAAAAGSSTDSLATSADALAAAQQKIIDNFTILKQGALDQETANSRWQAALDSVTASTKENGTSLDVHTTKGRANRASITDAISALNDKVSADFKANVETKGLAKATDIASEALKKGKKRIDESATAAGLNKTQVKNMQDQMLLTPKQLKTDIKTPGMTDAKRNIGDLQSAINALVDKRISITAAMHVEADKAVASLNQNLTSQNGKNGKTIQLYSTGGPVWGAGSATSDSIDARLSNGEFVVKAKSTEKIGRHRLAHMNETGEIPAYATGGTVQRDIDIHGSSNLAPNISGVYNGPAAALQKSAADYMNTLTSAYAKALNDAQEKVSGDFGKIDVSNPRGHTTFRGHTFSNLFAASLRKAETDTSHQFQIFQGGFRPATSYSGTSHQGDAIDAQVDMALLRASRKHGIPMWDRTGKGNWVSHMHGIPLPGAGFPAGSAVWQGQDYLRGGDGLADGGIVKGGRGGVRTMVGEGRFDELVTPLPKGWNLAKGYAAGGLVSAPASIGGKSSAFDLPMVARLIRALTTPIADLAAATRAVHTAQVRVGSLTKAARGPHDAYTAAKGKFDDAVEERSDARQARATVRKRDGDHIADLRQLVKLDNDGTKTYLANLRKKASATKGNTAEDRRYHAAVAATQSDTKLEKQLANARAAASKRTRQYSKDLADLNKKVEDTRKVRDSTNKTYQDAMARSSKATDDLRTKQAALRDQQNQLAESARSMSEQFRSAYQSSSTDAGDWLQLMKDGAADIGKFNAKIVALRKAGLSETLVQQIIGMGAVAGTDVAVQIAKGGKGLVDSLNKANQNLQNASDQLGYTGASGQGRYATGGVVGGFGGPTQDNQMVRASRGELVVNASDTAQVRSGRKVIDRNYVRGMRSGGWVNTLMGPSSHDDSLTLTVMGDVIDPDKTMRAMNTQRKNALTVRGLRRRQVG